MIPDDHDWHSTMSTDLYRVRVLDLDPTQRKVTFRVFLVYYDWSGVPTDPSFFFRILWDEADARFGGGGPLGEEVDVRHYLDEAWVNENTQRFVERVTRLSLRNDPLPEGKTPPTFVYDGYTDEDSLTQGDYEVIVTDARWIAHLKVGQTWQTTSYETRAVMPKERATRLLEEEAAGEDEGRVRKRKVSRRTAQRMMSEAEAKAATKMKTAGKGAAKPTAGEKTASKSAAKKTAGKKTASKGAAKKSASKGAAKKSASKGAAKKSAAKKSASKGAAKKTASKGAAKKTAAQKTASKRAAKAAASV